MDNRIDGFCYYLDYKAGGTDAKNCANNSWRNYRFWDNNTWSLARACKYDPTPAWWQKKIRNCGSWTVNTGY